VSEIESIGRFLQQGRYEEAKEKYADNMIGYDLGQKYTMEYKAPNIEYK